jgi:hypothetical protein
VKTIKSSRNRSELRVIDFKTIRCSQCRRGVTHGDAYATSCMTQTEISLFKNESSSERLTLSEFIIRAGIKSKKLLT